MKGYKAFNKDLQCQGYQFEIGVWHEHQGLLELCRSGFHFCKWPSGPWCYYSDEGTRIFEVEAENVLDIKEEPGTDFKLVAAKIKLLKEITPGGDRNTGNSNTGNRNTGYRNTGDSNTGNRNTGDSNTGDWNTGNRNTGYRNTGDSNTGDSNTGDRNTGYRNTGDRNTGYRNTGDWNTGYRNTGYRNTGDSNTGDWNTGDSNTGNSNTGYRNTGDWNTGNSNTGYRNTGYRNTGAWNTGNWNTTNFSSGFFCQVEPKVVSFDIQTEFTRQDFLDKFPEVYRLGESLMKDDPINFLDYQNIPGITEEKLKTLHQKFIEGRKRNETKT